MLRFFFVILISLPIAVFYLGRAAYIERHDALYTEAQRYELAREAVSILQRNGRIHTEIFGAENLPPEGGYVMYPNHQGKYDALGIISGHEKPCTVMIDDSRSHKPITTQFITLLKGSRLDKTDMKNQLRTILDIIDQVKAGRRYIVFPEGGYYRNRNEVNDFLPGAFKCSIKSCTPIVPVALIDSYRPFELNSLKKVHTQVHFLPPIPYEEYRGLNSHEIAELTRGQIVAKIKEITDADRRRTSLC